MKEITEPVEQSEELNNDQDNETAVSKKKSENKVQEDPKNDNAVTNEQSL